MLGLLLALAVQDAPATPAQGVIDAEYAFAADAQTLGQWTAFRKWASDDATMFTPAPVNAQNWLKDRADPPAAIAWWPTASYIACDGSLAVTTGGWERPDGTTGSFTTVWDHQPDGGWKWIVDYGDLDPAPGRTGQPEVQTADCGEAIQWEKDDDAPGVTETGASDDSTLVWRWVSFPDGYRSIEVLLWDGDGWTPVLSREMSASE